VGVIRRPRTTLRGVAAAPRWAGLLLLLWLVTAAANAALLSTAVGKQALVDQWERTAIAFGAPVDDAQYAEFQRLSETGPLYAVVTALASGPLATFAVALLIFWAGRGVQRGAAGVAGGPAPGPAMRQVLAVAAHAGVILALRQLVAAPLNYSRETLASPTSLSLFFTMVDEASPLARFFGALDLFVLWWVLVLAIGVAALYGIPVRRALYPLLGVYLAVALLLAASMAVMGGSA
jgi:hypothetical protein